MKFNLGVRSRDIKRNWHSWFAWHPVKVWDHNSSTGTELIVFLEKLHRRRVYNNPKNSKSFFYVYADINKELEK